MATRTSSILLDLVGLLVSRHGLLQLSVLFVNLAGGDPGAGLVRMVGAGQARGHARFDDHVLLDVARPPGGAADRPGRATVHRRPGRAWPLRRPGPTVPSACRPRPSARPGCERWIWPPGNRPFGLGFGLGLGLANEIHRRAESTSPAGRAPPARCPVRLPACSRPAPGGIPPARGPAP